MPTHEHPDFKSTKPPRAVYSTETVTALISCSSLGPNIAQAFHSNALHLNTLHESLRAMVKPSAPKTSARNFSLAHIEQTGLCCTQQARTTVTHILELSQCGETRRLLYKRKAQLLCCATAGQR